MTALAADLASALDPVAFARSAGFVAEPWQERLLRTGARRVLVACARQVGKSTVTASRATHTAIYRPGSLVLVISPSQRQSDELLIRIKSLYRALGRPVGSVRDSGSELVLGNNSRIVSLPGSEGTSRGFSAASLVILDEAARIDDDIFASVLPMVASDGAIWALSTPFGMRGWFHGLHDAVGNGWERHRVTVNESAQYDAARIAEVRASVGSFTFASDYLCEFGDTNSQLFSSQAVRAAFDAAIPPLFPMGA